MMNETLGRIHFVGSLVCMNVIFMPMFIQGLAGVNRRLWDGGALYTHAQGTLSLNVPMSYAAFALAFFQLFFIVNLFVEHPGRPRRRRQSVGGDDARVGDADAAAAHGNFDAAAARVPRSLRLQRAGRGGRLPAAESGDAPERSAWRA